MLDITPEFKKALNLVAFTSNSIFLTGKAGTGKSTFLRYVCDHTKKKHVVLAPTGIAAINAGGSTLHSFFKLPFHPLVPDDSRFASPSRIRDFLKYNKVHVKLIKEVELVIIDEISMVRADIIDFIDRILRIYSGNLRMPFGGKQMLLIGDIYQLEPVVTRDERDILRRFYDTPFFFSARVFREMQLVSISLNKVYRQTDLAFVSVLYHIRVNQVSEADLQLLNTCFVPADHEEEKEEDGDNNHPLTITLAPRRDTVDCINNSHLADLPGDVSLFKGHIEGDFPETSLPTLLNLELKVGAQVIFVKNDIDKQWVNGTLGTIIGMDGEGKYLYVRTDDGRELDVERAQWENVRYTYNEKEKKIEEEQLGVFVQFPLRLAWAITIHKSQGLTFSHVCIDFSGGVFAGGQTYVALSRCRSLNGLTLRKTISRADVFVNPAIVTFAKRFNDETAVEQALQRAFADIEYHDAIDAFDSGDFQTFMTHFFKAIHLRYDIESPLHQRYIRRKLGIINTLREQIDELKSLLKEEKNRQDEKQQMLNDFAKEYMMMAREAMRMGEPDAALANLDKALKMNPRHVDAWAERGKVLREKGQLHESMKALNEAIRLSPLSFKALFQRAKTRLQIGLLEEAATDADKAIGVKGDNILVHELYGDILARQGKEEEAAIQWALAERLRQKKRQKKGESTD